MKPLNPIVNQLLKQRHDSKSLLNEYLRPPPMPGAAAGESAAAKAARAATRAAAAEESAAARAARYGGFEPRQTAIDVYLETSRINPGKSDPESLSKALDELANQVRTIGPNISVKNSESAKQMIWSEIVKQNPQIIEIKNESLQNGLLQLINNYVENPTPLTVTSPKEAPEPQPVKLTVDTGIKSTTPETEMQPETKLDPLAQTIIAAALASAPQFKPEPLPQLEKIKSKPKTATATKQARKPEDEDEEDFEPEVPKKKPEDFETEVDGTIDPLKQFLQKKSLGDYSSVFLMK